jgi:hypothetical protein
MHVPLQISSALYPSVSLDLSRDTVPTGLFCSSSEGFLSHLSVSQLDRVTGTNGPCKFGNQPIARREASKC